MKPYFRNFSTQIQKRCGFRQISWLSVALWAVTIIILFSFTIRDFLPLLKEYKSENTETHIDVILESTQILRPKLTVCVPYYSNSLKNLVDYLKQQTFGDQTVSLNESDESQVECYACDGLIRRKWDVWTNDSRLTELLNGTASPKNYVANLFVRKLFSYNLTRSKFMDEILTPTDSDFGWNQPIIDSIWSFVSCAYVHDWATIEGNPSEFSTDDCAGLNYTILRPFDEIIDFLYDLALDTFGVYYSHTVVNTTDNPKLNSDLVDFQLENPILLPQKLCHNLGTKMPEERVVFGSEYFADQDVPWKKSEETGSIQIFEDPPTISSLNHQREILNGTDETLLKDAVNTRISLTYAVQTRVMEERQSSDCSREPLILECIRNATATRIIKLCNCVPFGIKSARQKFDQLPYCNVKFYDRCIKSSADGGFDFKAVKARCMKKCDHTFYNWKITTGIFAEETTNTPLGFDLEMMFFQVNKPYTQFALRTKVSAEEFVAQVGGLVNFYLGLSGLTVCAFVIFVIDLVKHWRQYRTSQHRDSEDAINRMGSYFWQMRLLNMIRGNTVSKKLQLDDADINEICDRVLTSIETKLMDSFQKKLKLQEQSV